MAQVKFVTRTKYKGVFYDAHTPFQVDDNDVPTLVQNGAIVTVAPEEAAKSIDSMKVDELKAYAEAHNIDISGVEKKADIIAVIKEAEAETNDGDAD